MADITTAENPEVVNKPSVHIVVLDRQEYEQIKNFANEMVNVDMDSYVESDGKKSIANEGAGPCAIFYAINKNTGEVVSGHYPEVSEKRDKRFIQQELVKASRLMTDQEPGILLPTQEQTKWLSDPTKIIHGYGKFDQMMKRVSQLSETWGRNNIEVHLFGQNPIIYGEGVEKNQRLVNKAIEHNDLIVRVREHNVPEFNIHDHRTLTQDGVDYTFYDPTQKTIYHYKKVDRK